jgi:hypothetical protein
MKVSELFETTTNELAQFISGMFNNARNEPISVAPDEIDAMVAQQLSLTPKQHQLVVGYIDNHLHQPPNTIPQDHEVIQWIDQQHM